MVCRKSHSDPESGLTSAPGFKEVQWGNSLINERGVKIINTAPDEDTPEIPVEGGSEQPSDAVKENNEAVQKNLDQQRGVLEGRVNVLEEQYNQNKTPENAKKVVDALQALITFMQENTITVTRRLNNGTGEEFNLQDRLQEKLNRYKQAAGIENNTQPDLVTPLPFDLNSETPDLVTPLLNTIDSENQDQVAKL